MQTEGFFFTLVFKMAKVAQRDDFFSIPCGVPNPWSHFVSPIGRTAVARILEEDDAPAPKGKNTCRHPGWAGNRRSWPVARRHAIVSGRGRATDRREAAQPRSLGRAGCGIRLSKNLRRNRSVIRRPRRELFPTTVIIYYCILASVLPSPIFLSTIFLSPSPW